jgi:hypothetical protein
LLSAIANMLWTNNFVFMGVMPISSPKSLHSHTHWHPPDAAATYYDSQEKSVVTFCFYNVQMTSLDPRKNTMPVVLRRSAMSPA